MQKVIGAIHLDTIQTATSATLLWSTELHFCLWQREWRKLQQLISKIATITTRVEERIF